MAYTASKSQSQGRPGFIISFRHPLRKDKQGKPGLKIRRGLGTSDSTKADVLIKQMNQLLSDESWWNASKQLIAQQQGFDPIIVDAFFGEMQAVRSDTRQLRDRFLPLPTKEDGCAQILFVGTTGAGKTSLLRHCIGSHPIEDRFPSTSTARTTVSDIEVIPQEGEYRAVVTFFSEFVIQANIEDCIRNACNSVWEQQADNKIAEAFLNHPDQRFRLGYILGNWESPIEQPEDDWSFGDDENELDLGDSTEKVGDDDVRNNQEQLKNFISKVKSFAGDLRRKTISLLDVGSLAALSDDDAAAANDIFLEQVEDDLRFSELVFDVLAEVSKRFNLLDDGLHRPRLASDWPDYWTYTTTDRAEFISKIRWFSSNYAKSFGKLLTPLVDGIRVAGPLYPDFLKQGDGLPKVVLIDGQGLGHTADSASSVTTHITKRFETVDVILLVDNAQQPIQAAAQAVLRSVASSGHHAKLAIAFTHFDQVKGDNLRGADAKKAHVLASVTNYLFRLKEGTSSAVALSMEKALEQQCFMFGGLDMPNQKLPKAIVNEFKRLFGFFAKSICPPIPLEAHPIYDPSGINFAVQRATNIFQKTWGARLGLASISGISVEHWTRVKALSSRVSQQISDEYDSLKPVADLVGRMADEISKYLDNPINWTRVPNSDEEAQKAISIVRQKVYAKLHQILSQRVVDEHLAEWREAWNHSGKGSSTKRALNIRSIYEMAAPVPSTVNKTPALNFLSEIRTMVISSIEESGGKVELAK